MITFLVAGHETTSGALSSPCTTSQVWGDTAVPGYDQVAKLRYVRRVLDESQRLWPTVPAFTREAREDTLLGGVHPMRRGAWPFGTGARACIGRQFALHEARLVLGLLLRRYEFRSDPAYRLRVTERLTLMPEGLRLRLERRAAGTPVTAPVSPGTAEDAPSELGCPVHRAAD
ncbi:hypothetical protein ADL12_10690 [Streptomyces regalis]|uniref:Cytochrome n=1 Tax=Streptomyces regalis TaxID=68262 RepID=A0A0X3VAP7_9ACTN|nr:hypothetical protein ADL12_10690 [Streptomyces regalis]